MPRVFPAVKSIVVVPWPEVTLPVLVPGMIDQVYVATGSLLTFATLAVIHSSPGCTEVGAMNAARGAGTTVAFALPTALIPAVFNTVTVAVTVTLPELVSRAL